MDRRALASGTTRRRSVYDANRGVPSASGLANTTLSNVIVNRIPRSRKFLINPYSGYRAALNGTTDSSMNARMRLVRSEIAEPDGSRFGRGHATRYADCAGAGCSVARSG